MKVWRQNLRLYNTDEHWLFTVIFQCADDKNREIVLLHWGKLVDVCKHEGHNRAVRTADS